MFPLQKLPAVQANPQDFRLLTKLPELARPFIIRESFPEHEQPLLIVDVETTGLDHQKDSVIEIGLCLCSYLPGEEHITRIIKSDSYYNDPGFPIPELITKLTGITDEMVRGHRIDWEKHLSAYFAGRPLVVAHNAPFDRPFVEPLLPAEKQNLPWACSCNEIDWAELGHEGAKLSYLGVDHGFFYDSHRAKADCEAVAWMLAKNKKAFRQLLCRALSPSVTVAAVRAPYDVKDDLKAAGYRWDGTVWSKAVPEFQEGAELKFLDALPGYSSKRARLTRLDATERFKAGAR